MGPEEEFEKFDSDNSWNSVFQVGSDGDIDPVTVKIANWLLIRQPEL